MAEELDAPPEKVQLAKRAGRATTSLDEHHGQSEEGKVFGDLFADETMPLPDERARGDLLKDKLQELLAEKLTDRERRIIRLRCGLEDYQPRTLREVAQIFDLSRERIRQLQNRAIGKLRQPEVKDRLSAYKELGG